MLNYFTKKKTGSTRLKLPMKELVGEFSTITVEAHELESKIKVDWGKVL